MKKETRTLPFLDIHLSAFLVLNGIEPSLVKQSGRVIFQFPNNAQVSSLVEKYNSNPKVDVLNYVQHLRRLRSQMLSMRG